MPWIEEKEHKKYLSQQWVGSASQSAGNLCQFPQEQYPAALVPRDSARLCSHTEKRGMETHQAVPC